MYYYYIYSLNNKEIISELYETFDRGEFNQLKSLITDNFIANFLQISTSLNRNEFAEFGQKISQVFWANIAQIKFLLFLLPLAIGVATVYSYARIHTLECVRDRFGKVSATITHSGINYFKKEEIPAGELLHAELEIDSYKDSKGEITTVYRVRLITTKDPNFSTKIGSLKSDDVIRKIEQINYFIQESTQESMSLTQDDRLIAYIWAGMFGLVVFIMVSIILTNF
jgi:hypothetical protein